MGNIDETAHRFIYARYRAMLKERDHASNPPILDISKKYNARCMIVFVTSNPPRGHEDLYLKIESAGACRIFLIGV